MKKNFKTHHFGKFFYFGIRLLIICGIYVRLKGTSSVFVGGELKEEHREPLWDSWRRLGIPSLVTRNVTNTSRMGDSWDSSYYKYHSTPPDLLAEGFNVGLRTLDTYKK